MIPCIGVHAKNFHERKFAMGSLYGAFLCNVLSLFDCRKNSSVKMPCMHAIISRGQRFVIKMQSERIHMVAASIREAVCVR